MNNVWNNIGINCIWNKKLESGSKIWTRRMKSYCVLKIRINSSVMIIFRGVSEHA